MYRLHLTDRDQQPVAHRRNLLEQGITGWMGRTHAHHLSGSQPCGLFR